MRFTLLLTVFAATAFALPTSSSTQEDSLAARSELPSQPVAAAALSAETLPRTEAAAGNLMARVADPSAAKAQPHPDDASLEIEEKTTASGKKYRVVRPRGSAQLEAAHAQNGTSKRWVPGDHFHMGLLPIWQANHGDGLSQQMQAVTGLSAWSIDFGGVFYKWRLNFWEKGFQYDYGFQDQTGDWYWCKVYLDGRHYIDYNSDGPSMVAVQGD